LPNHQRHRGQQPNDAKVFSEKWVPTLQEAVRDYSLLLSRGYPETATLQLVGNRYRLNERQMKAVFRASCSNQALLLRQRTALEFGDLFQETIAIDGYNLLITLESVLSNGIILFCRDGCFRDMASIHSTYKRVEETIPAIELIGETLNELGVFQANWYLDSPVSNSGRLKMLLLEIATQKGWNWNAELVFNPDKTLLETNQIIISSDSWILDRAKLWFNMLAYIIEKKLTDVPITYLG
jgi:hypothetical protein